MNRTAAIALLSLVATVPARAAVSISADPTKNMNCQDGTCVPTAKVATLNVGDLANMLAQADAKVFTGNGAVTIQVTAPLSWTSAHMLTLTADHSVSFRAGVTVAGPGGLAIVDNRLDDGGQLLFFPGGSVSFWDTTSSLSINTVSYTLVADMPTLASDIAANPSGAYALAKSYNAFVDGIYLHSPVPTVFHGTFEGLGNTIDQLTIQNPSTTDLEVGLFSETGSGSLVQDIHLTNLSIDVNEPQYVGGLVGANRGGTIFNASTAGTVVGGVGNGGFVGDNDTAIYDSSSSASVSGALVGGGFAGESLGVIVGSHASGPVSALQEAGGLTSYALGTITDSSASGSVSTAGYLAGGFAAVISDATVVRCFSTGDVTLDETAGARRKTPGFSVGGFVGTAAGTIAASYATGSVSGSGPSGTKKNAAGGFAGRGGGIEQGYSTGKVEVGHGFAGGFVGEDPREHDIKTAYWDLDTSGIGDHSRGAGNIVSDPGIKGLSTKRFTAGLPKGFDPSLWAQSPSVNNGYPYLISNPPQ